MKKEQLDNTGNDEPRIGGEYLGNIYCKSQFAFESMWEGNKKRPFKITCLSHFLVFNCIKKLKILRKSGGL